MTVFRVEVLSEEPISDDVSLSVIDSWITEGDCSGRFLDTLYEELDGKQAAAALIEQASEPSFFQIDEEGNDAEW